MIELGAPRLPDNVAVSEQDAEVEVGFDAALNGKLLFPSLPPRTWSPRPVQTPPGRRPAVSTVPRHARACCESDSRETGRSR